MSRTGKRWFKALEEITDPDFIWGALDNVHDAETTLADYAASVSRAQRAALAASMAAPDCHQPDLVTAEAEQPVARLVEAAQWARNRLETIADDCWHGDARDFKRSLVGVFADFDEAMANCGSHVPPEIRTVTPALEVQPLTVQDAQCCMCGKRGLSTAEDGGPECELADGRWVCSRGCYERAVDGFTVQDAARHILSDDIAISHMAQALHDGPLGADDYWFSAARPQGAWCVDAVRVVLRAIAEGRA